MPLLVLAFPAIDPVALEIGPIQIRWYALAYVASLLLAWRYVRRLSLGQPAVMSGEAVDDLLVWATLGVILGGRLGYVLFYKPGYYLAHPVEALQVWQGGMSFHGGLLGVTLAILLFACGLKLSPLRVADMVAPAVPIGLGLGRLANFVNGELFGRVSDVSWAMVFPMGGPAPRHPSQLYQAALEGVVLFLVLFVATGNARLRERSGMLTGIFLIGYAIARGVGELFRQPDAHIGFLLAGATMGQLLSLPMLAAGIWLVWRRTGR
ncbi:MAG: prolipoprotein diacylglyceryl transferase [Alphaproteobacteria bacterium]|nr:prolipoprotein diacylglyceryl transferase [Alphaproteobacteria bacterium]